MLLKLLYVAGAIITSVTFSPAANAVAVISAAAPVAVESETATKPNAGEPASGSVKRPPIDEAIPEWEVIGLLVAGFGLVAVTARHRKRLTKIAYM